MILRIRGVFWNIGQHCLVATDLFIEYFCISKLTVDENKSILLNCNLILIFAEYQEIAIAVEPRLFEPALSGRCIILTRFACKKFKLEQKFVLTINVYYYYWR